MGSEAWIGEGLQHEKVGCSELHWPENTGIWATKPVFFAVPASPIAESREVDRGVNAMLHPNHTIFQLARYLR